jgi:hypothetical protein
LVLCFGWLWCSFSWFAAPWLLALAH